MSRWWDLTRVRKRKHYTVLVSPEIYARVRAEAERRGISMAQLVGEAIEATVPEVLK